MTDILFILTGITAAASTGFWILTHFRRKETGETADSAVMMLYSARGNTDTGQDRSARGPAPGSPPTPE